MNSSNRRDFLKTTAAGAGLVLLSPVAISCGGASQEDTQPIAGAIPPLPTSLPADWDPIVFNRERGNAGAIPELYHAAINGPDGATKHIGKHLPYLAPVEPTLVGAGYLPIMWGDPAKGYAQHPNDAQNDETGFAGHWFTWVRVRKATSGEAEERETRFDNWPIPGAGSTGTFSVLGGGGITANSGKNTIYKVSLPGDVGPGDTVRVCGYCLNHGEYVDFLTLRG